MPLSVADQAKYEQLILEMINRARLDPAGEAARLGIALNEGLRAGTISATAKQPLAMNDQLVTSARGHSQHMINVDKFAHDGIGDGTIGSRMEAAGYGFTGAWTRGENIGFNGTTAAVPAKEFAIKDANDLFVDAGYAGRGHRLNILDADYSEIGIGYQTGVYTMNRVNYNAGMLTQDFAKSGTDIFITGVAITDTNNNNFYDIGEGRANITVSVAGSAGALGRDITSVAGGYSTGIVASAGAIDVTFSGGGLAHSVTARVNGGTSNIKIDLAGAGEILSSASTTLGDGATALTLLGVAGLSGTGNAAANVMTGNKAGNLLFGLGGGDNINGGLGNDVINGGAGRDILTGSSGNDQFRFTAISDMGNAVATRDVIIDMKKTAATGADRIHLADIDARPGEAAANDAFTFLAAKGAAFTAIGQIRWLQQDLAGTANDKTIILGNTDHDLRTSEFQIEIRGLVNLAATDFIL